MSHQATVPARIAAYFGIDQHPPYREFPTIDATWVPGRGWRSYPFTKRVSTSWFRKLRAEGVVSVQVCYGDRHADFDIREVAR